MDRHLLECLDLVDKVTERAVMNRELSGSPFVSYTNDAHDMFSGFRVIAEILQVDLMRESCDREEDRLLSRNQKSGLLGLIRSTSWVMEKHASEVMDWAHKRLEAKK